MAVRHLVGSVLALGVCGGVAAGRVATGDEQPRVQAVVATPVRTVTTVRTTTVEVRRKRVVRRPTTTAARDTTGRSGEPVAVPDEEPQDATPRRTADARSPATRPSAAAPSTPPAAPVAADVEGDVIETRYGPVQVSLTLHGARIVDVRALQAPDDLERSREIDADALPKLRAQVLAAQSAAIDGVAGATYTSDGYRRSVQSALDVA